MPEFPVLPRPSRWKAREWDGTEDAKDWAAQWFGDIGQVVTWVGDDMYYGGNVVPLGAWMVIDPVIFTWYVFPDLDALNVRFMAPPDEAPFTGE